MSIQIHCAGCHGHPFDEDHVCDDHNYVYGSHWIESEYPSCPGIPPDRRLEAAKGMAAAISPLIKSYEKDISAANEARKAWYERMPAEWPLKLKITMGQYRQSRAALILWQEANK